MKKKEMRKKQQQQQQSETNEKLYTKLFLCTFETCK